MECNCLFISKLQRDNRWSLGMDKLFHLTLNQACDYLSMLELKLNHVSKSDPRRKMWNLSKMYKTTCHPLHLGTVLMAECKTALFLLLMLWTYCSLALSHRYRINVYYFVIIHVYSDAGKAHWWIFLLNAMGTQAYWCQHVGGLNNYFVLCSCFTDNDGYYSSLFRHS